MLVKQNIEPKVYNKLDKSLKTKITNILANDFLAMLVNGRFIRDGGAELDNKRHVETLLYYFDINDRNRNEFKQQLTAQLQNTFVSITGLLPRQYQTLRNQPIQNNEAPLPPTPVNNHGPLPVPAAAVEKTAPASMRLKR